MPTTPGNPFFQNAPYAQDGWVKTGTPNNIRWQLTNPHNQRVAVIGSRVGLNDQIAKDITAPIALNQPLSDTAWRWRVILNWPTFNAFRNKDVLFQPSNSVDIVLSDSDQTVNTGTNSPGQKFIGMRISNFNGNSPTFSIRINPFQGLLAGIVRDGAVITGTGSFTPGGQPSAQTNTHIEIERSGALMTIRLFTDATFTLPVIEEKTLAIPSGVVGLKYIKVSNFNFSNTKHALIAGNLFSYELLDGIPPVTPVGGTKPDSLYSKLHEAN